MTTLKQKTPLPTSIRLPKEIIVCLRKAASQEERSGNKQILFILKNWLIKNRYLKR